MGVARDENSSRRDGYLTAVGIFDGPEMRHMILLGGEIDRPLEFSFEIAAPLEHVAGIAAHAAGDFCGAIVFAQFYERTL